MLGPIRSRRRAQQAARALLPEELERPRAALPRLRRKVAELAEARRYEDAARLRDRVDALERVCRELERLARLRTLQRCLVVPAAEPGFARALFIAGGRVAAVRTLPAGTGAHLEVEAGLAAARRAVAESSNSLLLDLEELFLVGTFLRRPPPELSIVPMRKDAILRAGARAAAATRGPSHVRNTPVPVTVTGTGPCEAALF